jgi:hypothetical protein
MAQSLLLQNLPTEVLVAIFSFVQDSQSVLNLCLQSHFFKEIAEPVLYTNFTGPDGNKFGRTKQTRAFHLAILRRPELAQHVRSMSLQAHWTELGSCPPEVLDGFKSKELALLFPEAQKSTTSSTYRNWLSYVEEGPEEALLLTAVPKLENLHLSMGWYPVRYLETVFSLAREHDVDFLKRLHGLKIIYRASGRGLNLSNFVQLLRLPSLEKFEARYVSIELDDERQRSTLYREEASRPRQYEFQPDSLSFQTLKLYESAICGQAMLKILNACKALKIFHYSNGSPGRGYEQFSPAQLYPGLSKHKNILEEIRLMDISATISGPDGDHVLGSFADFPLLKSVGAEQTVLVGRPAPSRNCNGCRFFECCWSRPACMCSRLNLQDLPSLIKSRFFMCRA